jgi:hypothetical protein
MLIDLIMLGLLVIGDTSHIVGTSDIATLVPCFVLVYTEPNNNL